MIMPVCTLLFDSYCKKQTEASSIHTQQLNSMQLSIELVVVAVVAAIDVHALAAQRGPMTHGASFKVWAVSD